MPSESKPGNVVCIVRATVLPLIGGVLLSCGPSVSSIYEGNIRFEHCYRLDLDPNIAPTHREACWREWTARYTYGQTRDRLDYARRRIGQLSAGDTSRPVLNLTGGKQELAAAPSEAPAPVSARKPPPPTAPVAPPDGGAPDALTSPEAECVEKCAETLNSCSQACKKDQNLAGVPCEPCAGDYRSCMRRCFE